MSVLLSGIVFRVRAVHDDQMGYFARQFQLIGEPWLDGGDGRPAVDEGVRVDGLVVGSQCNVDNFVDRAAGCLFAVWDRL